MKRRLFIKEMNQPGMTYTEAARRAEYKHPRMAGSRLMTNDDFREIFRHVMDLAGLTDERLCEALKEGLEATKIIYVRK